MNKIKLSVLSLGIFFASAAIAQDQKPQMTKEQRIEKRMDHLASELDLTVAQKEQITVLNKKSVESRRKIKSDDSLDEAAKKAAMKSIHQEKKAEMAKVLNDEQAAKLKALKAERKANHQKGHAKKHTHKECHHGKKGVVKSDVQIKEHKNNHRRAVK